MPEIWGDEDDIIEGGADSDVSPAGSWARAWLDEVSEAREAIDRADKLADWRRQKAYALPAHIETDVPEMVDAENERATAYTWAKEVLDDFDELASVQRASLRGELLEGLDIAEAKYRLGMKNRAITSNFCMSNDTMYRRLAAFTDYLDYLGPDLAFRPEADERQVVPVGFAAPPTVAEQLEAVGIMAGLDEVCGQP